MAGETTTIDTGDAGADTGGGDAELPGGEETIPGAEEGNERGRRAEAPKPPAQKRTYKYKVDGKDEQEELTEEDLAQRLSHSRAASKRMAEAARERKAVAAERQKLEQDREALTAAQKAVAGDPNALRKYLREQAGDPQKAHKLLVQALKEEIAEMNLDPTERRLRELEAEKSARDAADAEAKTKSEKVEQEARVKAAIEKHRPVFVQRLGAIMEIQGVPKNDATLGIAAEVYLENAREKIGLTNEEMAEAIKDRTVGVVRDMATTWTGEDWEKNDPATYKKILRHAAAKIRGRQGQAAGSTQREGPAVRTKGEGRQTESGGRLPPSKPLSRQEEREIYKA